MENETIEGKIEEYLKLFGDIKARTGDDRTAMNILQEVKKDIRMAQIRAERENGNGGASNHNLGDCTPATLRQREFLRKLNVKIPAGLTKKEASRLIDEAREKESEQDSSRLIPENLVLPWQRAWY